MTKHNNTCCSLYIDGGARGNPGPAAAGWLIKDPSGKILLEKGKFLGTTTNNVAEYQALIGGLEDAYEKGIRSLNIFSDSELLVKQIKGVYKTKNETLKLLKERMAQLIHAFDQFSITHIRREYNKEADRIVNDVLDLHKQTK